MTYRLGDGLPSTLTPERIKKVLAFENNQERELTEALDSGGAVAWTNTDSDSDLYPRLCKLLHTADGREAYQKARTVFEKKRKRRYRADLLKCLTETYLSEVPEVCEWYSGKKHLSVPSAMEALAQAGAWEYLAEFVWACSAMGDPGDVSERSQILVHALDSYPNIKPFLEEVQANIASVGDPEERSDPEEHDAAKDVARIKEIAARLDPKQLHPAELEELASSANRLIEFAKELTSQQRVVERQRLRISDWRQRNAEALVDASELEGRLEAIQTRVDAGDMKDPELETSLLQCEEIFEIKSRLKEAEEAAKPFLAEAKSLELKLDAVYAAIDSEQSASPGEENQESLSSQTAERQSDAPDDEPEATAPALDTDSEPIAAGDAAKDGGTVAGEVAPPDGPGEDAEPTAVDEAANGDVASPSEPAPSEGPGEDAGRTALPKSGRDSRVAQVEQAIATEIERGRFGIAYHLARAEPKALPSASAIALVAYNHTDYEHASVTVDLSYHANAVLGEVGAILNDKLGQPIPNGYAALLAGAALTPSLIVPGGAVAQLLASLEPHLRKTQSLWELSHAAAGVSIKGIYLPIESLQEDDSLDKWNARKSALDDETRHWWEREQRARLRFHAATIVWQSMLKVWEDGDRASIGHLFGLLLDDPADDIDIERAYAVTKHWEGNWDKEIDQIDKNNRARASAKPIEGRGRRDLENKIKEALDLAARWRRLIEARPDRRPEFHQTQAVALRASVQEHAEKALKEIHDLDTPMARVASKLVERYVSLFENEAVDASSPTRTLSDLLNGDLLVCPEVDLGDLDRQDRISLDIEGLLDLANREEHDFGNAAIQRAARDDFTGAEAALDFAERNRRLDEDRLESVRLEVEERRESFLRKLEDDIRKAGDRLDAAYARGVLPLETFEDLRGWIPQDDLTRNQEFDEVREAIQFVEDEVDKAGKKEGETLRQSLARLRNMSPKKLSPKDERKIEDAINNVELRVAQDYIDRIDNGDPRPDPEVETKGPFDEFFPRFAEEYARFHAENQDGSLSRIQQALEGSTAAGPVDASGISPDSARDGRRLLEAWSDLHHSQAGPDKLRTLIGAVGFAGVNVQEAESRHEDIRTYRLETIPLNNQDYSRLPDFGSLAGGRYQLVVVRNYKTEEAIIGNAEEWRADGAPPNIVLFLNVLDADARRALAHGFSSGKYAPTIVLDEALAVFLAARGGGSRLAAFLGCAQAFAYAQPYDPSATEVPPEMFFGREAERKKILAMSEADGMTHLVYGGRRMGKTTLLADIEREYRTRTPDQLVSLLNLKGTGVGESPRADGLWKLLAEELTKRKVIPAGTVHSSSIAKSVKQWLDQGTDRRILMLVDEADAFLEADGLDNYPVLEEVKRLMEDTRRRFKIVFAGLHNVQRTARNPNTPFAHLGEPVRIGPMLPEIDHGKIESLIRKPLEALGYRFASNDAVIRIAAETNYYPALAQQLCKELLRNMRDNGDVDGETGPPYTIPMEMVDEVFNSRETRDRVRKLFSRTIQLDPRYEFLTYLIARESFDNGSTLLRSLSIEDIRETAMREWQAGFAADPTYGMFEALLDEMVGLGILREIAAEEGEKRYAIRTRNLRMLLGNDAEIERRFADAKTREAPRTFDPDVFRNTLSNGVPSSLTFEQERRLFNPQKAVGIIFGTRLGGIDHIGESLKVAARRIWTNIREHKVVPDSMRGLLEQISRSRQAGIDIVLVDTQGAWDPQRVNEVLSFVARIDAQKRTVLPVFLCGPGEAWAWLNGERPRSQQRDVAMVDIWLNACARDFADRWLWKAGAVNDLKTPDRSVDLSWPIVLGMARKGISEDMAGAIDPALFNDDLVSDVLVEPTIGTALEVFSKFPGDSMSVSDLVGLSKDKAIVDRSISLEEASRVVNWASRLGILHSVGEVYRLDAAYAAGLKPRFGE